MIVKYITFCHNLLHNLLQSLIFASKYNTMQCKNNEKEPKSKSKRAKNDTTTLAGVYVDARISQ